jgi:hypothetical protein
MFIFYWYDGYFCDCVVGGGDFLPSLCKQDSMLEHHRVSEEELEHPHYPPNDWEHWHTQQWVHNTQDYQCLDHLHSFSKKSFQREQEELCWVYAVQDSRDWEWILHRQCVEREEYRLPREPQHPGQDWQDQSHNAHLSGCDDDCDAYHPTYQANLFENKEQQCIQEEELRDNLQ